MAHSEDLTALLQAWSTGDGGAGERLMTLVYDELRSLSCNRLRAHGGPVTLQATELISEAYLRLSAQSDTDWQNRGHFFAIAATVMRRVLLDQARRRHSAKRDRRLESSDNPEQLAMTSERAEQLLTLDAALDRLETLSPRQARVIELRYFGGLSIPEAAEMLEVSEATVKRDWALARAWLLNQLPGLGDL
ncbi:MAG: sigma-70 family RNA polymerase sigma factor [Wenzhouxiangella sp.]|nr:MAG: sigma-70 family RNA polymerase sigma factor [Wenzhouxiangella sp.]